MKTSPPIETGTTETAGWLRKAAAAADVLILNLHGFFGQEGLAGQRSGRIGPTALMPADLAGASWDDMVIFLEVCFSAADNEANREISRILYKAGAAAVIGSKGLAYGRINATPALPGFDGEADRLIFFFLRSLRRRMEPKRALAVAKRWLRIWSFPLDDDDQATLDSFTVITSKEDSR